MTTATLATGNRMTETALRPRPSLEELVGCLFTAMGVKDEMERLTGTMGVAKSLPEARRLRQSGDIDSALTVLAGVDMARATTREARWAYTEWTQLVGRRFGDRDVALYSQGTGRAAVLAPTGHGTLEVVSALGMRWRPGKRVSERSLRGLRPLANACP